MSEAAGNAGTRNAEKLESLQRYIGREALRYNQLVFIKNCEIVDLKKEVATQKSMLSCRNPHYVHAENRLWFKCDKCGWYAGDYCK